MSKAFLKQRTNGCDTLNPFCSRSSLHLRCVSNLWVLSVTQVHIVRSCCDRLQWTLGTRHTNRDDMQFKVVFLVALISVNTIWIISIYLAQNWAVSQWLSFRTSDLNAWYLQWFIYNFGLMSPGTRCFQYQRVPTANFWVQNTIFNDKSAILLHPGTRRDSLK